MLLLFGFHGVLRLSATPRCDYDSVENGIVQPVRAWGSMSTHLRSVRFL